MSYSVRPLTDRTWLDQAKKRTTQFSSTWVQTERLLLDEVAHLKGRNLVIGMDITEADLKLNGELRARARPSSDAVEVAFESAHGPMLYRCDRMLAPYGFQGPAWQHNVRAIAKTLEALRAVERYGAVDTGQQYAGFKALPAGRAMPASHMTRDRAIAILASYVDVPPQHLNLTPESLRHAWRRARRQAHPDAQSGDQTKWDQVEQAAQVLGVTS